MQRDAKRRRENVYLWKTNPHGYSWEYSLLKLNSNLIIMGYVLEDKTSSKGYRTDRCTMNLALSREVNF
jgi:hypothetical protein